MSHLFTLHYLPCIAWFQHYVRYPESCIELHDNYNKQTYRNRCKILAANGALDLIIPIKKKSSKQLYTTIELEFDFDWRSQHWQSIQSAYGKSAFFEFYADSFAKIYEDVSIKTLYAFNLQLLELVFKCLKMQQSISYTTTYSNEITTSLDFRGKYNPKNVNRANELLQPIVYWQVFEEKFGTIQNLSILDLLFNAGPESLSLLKK